MSRAQRIGSNGRVTGAQFIWLFFGFSGRISRAAFLLAGLLISVALIFIVYRLVLAQESGQPATGWEAALSLMSLAALWSQAALGAKRLHDIGKPGILAAALFFPFINFIAFVLLCLFPGDAGPNQYGTRTNAPG